LTLIQTIFKDDRRGEKSILNKLLLPYDGWHFKRVIIIIRAIDSNYN
jgi:hypothetical protein